VTTGAENDLERATSLVQQMVCMYGMSDRIGLFHCTRKQAAFLLDQGALQRDCSEQTSREIDEEVKAILDRAYEEASSLLEAHREELGRVTEELLRKETLDREAFLALLEKPPEDEEDSRS
jgi:cell division protease FtsH